MINMKTENIIFHRLTAHSFSYLLLPKHVLASSLGVHARVLLLDGLAPLRIKGVNSTLVRYFSCLNAPLFISHFLQTCYKSQLRTGKTDLHSKNQNFTKQTQNCTVKIYKHICKHIVIYYRENSLGVHLRSPGTRGVRV